MAARILRIAGLLALLLLPAVARARILPGIEAGLVFSTLDYDERPPEWDTGGRYSLSGGFTAELPIAERLSLVSGFRYLKFGNRVKFDSGPGEVEEIGEFKITQGYFALPVLLQARPASRMLLEFGPEIGFLATAKFDVEETVFYYGLVERLKNRVDIKDTIESTNVWFRAGVGYEFPLETHVLVVRARYLHGLTELAKPDSWLVQWHTRGVELSAGVWW